MNAYQRGKLSNTGLRISTEDERKEEELREGELELEMVVPRVSESQTCCPVQYYGESGIAPDCECQDALLRTRASVAPPFFIMPPPLNNAAFSLRPTILSPTAHPRSSSFGPSLYSSQLHHLPPTLPLTHLNSQLLP
jgi:hypothetical protein